MATLTAAGITFSNGTTQTTAATGVSTTYGAVGTYVVAYSRVYNGAYGASSTIAGSSLGRSAAASYGTNYGGSLSSQTYTNTLPVSLGLGGTWRAMTNSAVSSSGYYSNLWVRIS